MVCEIDKNKGALYVECEVAYHARVQKEIFDCKNFEEVALNPKAIQDLKWQHQAKKLKGLRWKNGNLPLTIFES